MAVATKDQLAAALVFGLPLALASRLWSLRPSARDGHDAASAEREAERRALWRGSGQLLLAAVATYAVAGGLLWNLLGWWRRVHWLLGPASKEWHDYAADAAGRAALLLDLGGGVFAGPWAFGLGVGVAFAALIGVVAALRRPAAERAGALLPLAAGASFVVLFNLGALRASPRFALLPGLMTLLLAAVGAATALARLDACERPPAASRRSRWPAGSRSPPAGSRHG